MGGNQNEACEKKSRQNLGRLDAQRSEAILTIIESEVSKKKETRAQRNRRCSNGHPSVRGRGGNYKGKRPGYGTHSEGSRCIMRKTKRGGREKKSWILGVVEKTWLELAPLSLDKKRPLGEGNFSSLRDVRGRGRKLAETIHSSQLERTGRTEEFAATTHCQKKDGLSTWFVAKKLTRIWAWVVRRQKRKTKFRADV